MNTEPFSAQNRIKILKEAENMANLTAKELSALEDQLAGEEILVKKYTAFAEQCTDNALKAKCNSIANTHRKHYNTLLGYLR